MKILLFVLAILAVNGCSSTTTNSVNYNSVSVESRAQNIVCGIVDGQKQTYPSMKELENDGADFSHYGPCY